MFGTDNCEKTQVASMIPTLNGPLKGQMENPGGPFSRTFVTDVPADLHTERAALFRKTIPQFPDEAVYIYSFLEQRFVYASGWENVLGFKDDEMNMLLFISLTTPRFAPFVNDLNDKALRFILQGHPDIEQYSFTIELKKYHKNGHEVPAMMRVGVFESVDNRPISIIGRLQVAPHLQFGEVMRYAAYGPEKGAFEEDLSKDLFAYPAISPKEREALILVASGMAFKEIADQLSISQSAVEKRILPLYKRFGVKSLPHLISYAHKNNLL